MRLEVLAAQLEVPVADIETWIAREWLLPARDAEGWQFEPADRARLTLIVELRRDFQANDEALPIILRLVDQLHSLHNRLRVLQTALQGLSPAAREEFDTIIRALDQE